MKSHRVILLAILFVGFTVPFSASAEQRRVSWIPPSTYIDGTPIGEDKALTYSVYWTTDPGLSTGSLQTLVSFLPETSFSFDPDDMGMPRGQTIFFTGESVLNTGERSSFSAAVAWNVPVLVPSSPSNIVASNQAPWQISWDAVTTYTDGSLIGPGKAILYTVYWTPDLWLEEGSLHQIGSPTSATSLSFDSAAAGMTDYQTVYFTIKAVLGTGEDSSFSGAFAWDVPFDGPIASKNPIAPENPIVPVNPIAPVNPIVPENPIAPENPVVPEKPIAPENMVVTYSAGDGTSGTYILSWDPVTRYRNGNPIEGGNRITYDLYWTTNPGLSARRLKTLSSSVESTSFPFDPSAFGMRRNKRIYFTGKSKLSTGEESALSSAVSWRVSNSGPAAPSSGRVVRKNPGRWRWR